MASQLHGVRIVQGDVERVLKQFDLLKKDVHNAVADEIEMTALEIESEAKRNCPVITGRLRASITTFLNRDRLAASVGTLVEYAPLVEFGGQGRRAKPYLYPAYFNNVQKMIKRLEKMSGKNA